MKARVDRELCMGAGNCVVVAPQAFKLDADNKAVLLDTSGVPDDVLMDAAEHCPFNAIIIEDDKGEQIYP